MPRKQRRIVGQAVTCGWCGATFPLAPTGRIPKWCSQTCRRRAWEQRRAARCGRAPVDVVVQLVEVDKPVKVPVIERVEVPLVPTRREWLAVLAELVDQLDRGRVYDRDLVDLATAVETVLRALERRPALQRLARQQAQRQRRW
jgi:hypothetical protein